MAERFIGKAVCEGAVGRREADGRIIGVVHAGLIPSIVTPEEFPTITLPAEADLYLEYNRKPDGKIGVTGFTIRFGEILQ